jgi:hypothetical protein
MRAAQGDGVRRAAPLLRDRRGAAPLDLAAGNEEGGMAHLLGRASSWA